MKHFRPALELTDKMLCIVACDILLKGFVILLHNNSKTYSFMPVHWVTSGNILQLQSSHESYVKKNSYDFKGSIRDSIFNVALGVAMVTFLTVHT